MQLLAELTREGRGEKKGGGEREASGSSVVVLSCISLCVSFLEQRLYGYGEGTALRGRLLEIRRHLARSKAYRMCMQQEK